MKRGSIQLARDLCAEIAGPNKEGNGDDYGSVDVAEILSAEVVRLKADNEALRELLADMKPHWDGFTRRVVWTAAMAGVMADLRTRLDAAMLAGKKQND